jgi:hypothetical protein
MLAEYFLLSSLRERERERNRQRLEEGGRGEKDK